MQISILVDILCPTIYNLNHNTLFTFPADALATNKLMTSFNELLEIVLIELTKHFEITRNSTNSVTIESDIRSII